MGRPINAAIEIAPGIKAKEWQNLQLDDPNSPDWEKAVEIFDQRIRGRFLDPISKIEEMKFSGFSVMALDCLLIETLEQFKRGVHETPRGCGKHFFVSFLTEFDLGLGDYFDESLAQLFYQQIRNGILHQAEVKGKSRLRIGLPRLVQRSPDGEGLVIDRRKFHRALVEVYKRYLQLLQDPAEQDLRTRFRRKMDAIVQEVL